MSLEIWLWQNRLFTGLCVSSRGQNTLWKVENDIISTETDKTTSQFTHLIGKKNATKANYYYICSKISKCLYFNYKIIITTPNSQSGHAPWTGEGKKFYCLTIAFANLAVLWNLGNFYEQLLGLMSERLHIGVGVLAYLTNNRPPRASENSDKIEDICTFFLSWVFEALCRLYLISNALDYYTNENRPT